MQLFISAVFHSWGSRRPFLAVRGPRAAGSMWSSPAASPLLSSINLGPAAASTRVGAGGARLFPLPWESGRHPEDAEFFPVVFRCLCPSKRGEPPNVASGTCRGCATSTSSCSLLLFLPIPLRAWFPEQTLDQNPRSLPRVPFICVPCLTFAVPAGPMADSWSPRLGFVELCRWPSSSSSACVGLYGFGDGPRPRQEDQAALPWLSWASEAGGGAGGFVLLQGIS